MFKRGEHIKEILRQKKEDILAGKMPHREHWQDHRIKLRHKKTRNRMLHRAGIIISLGLFGLVVRLLFFNDAFTATQQVQGFFFSLVAITVMWRGLEKINEILNRKFPFSRGVMPRVVIQLAIGQVFLYGFLFIMMLVVVPFLKEYTLTREILFSGLVVYLLINLAANGGIIGNYFFREWKKSLVKQAALEKEKSQAHFENLKNQLNPHFLFNSLSSLNSLIFENPELASQFLKQLSKVYRYLLDNNESHFVTLETEISFVKNYISLLQTRFDRGLDVAIDVPADSLRLKIIPVTLQILIENAIKHNITYEDNPLIIDIYTENTTLVIKNNVQPKTRVEGSNKKGLDNLRDLYYYSTGRELGIENSQQHFTVKIPLITE